MKEWKSSNSSNRMEEEEEEVEEVEEENGSRMGSIMKSEEMSLV